MEGGIASRVWNLRRHPGLLLAVVIVAAKLAMLAVDPVTRFFLGDSGIYVHAALTDTMPRDRSFLYASLIDVVAARPRTLGWLLMLQSLAGVAVALLAWTILRRSFALGALPAGAIALVIALGPEQLFYERMIMAECWGLLGFSAMLACGFAYLHRGHAGWLGGVIACGLFTVAFRTNLAPVVLGFSVLPVVVHAVAGAGRWRSWRFAAHLALVIVATTVAHAEYRKLPVRGTDGKPDYIAHAGYFRLGLVAPHVREDDLAGLGLPEGFLSRLRGGLDDPRERENHLWRNNGLIPTIRGTLGDVQGDRASRKIAARVIRRDPTILVTLGVATLFDYLDPAVTGERLRDDLGLYRFDDGFRAWIAENFNHDMSGMPERPSVVMSAFSASRPWLTFCLFALVPLALVVLAAAWRGTRRDTALLYALTACGLFAGHVLFSHIVSYRYLHAFPWMIGIGLGALCAMLPARSRQHVPPASGQVAHP